MYKLLQSTETLLAKSDGTTQVEHAKDVEFFSNKIVSSFISYKDEYWIIAIYYASIFHDIGKCCKHFQQFLDGNKTKPPKFKHHEIGWAFLYKYLNIDTELLELVLDSVYWHHGVEGEYKKDYAETILSTISDEDIQKMKEFVLVFLPGHSFAERKNEKLTPNFYSSTDKDGNAKKIIIRTCVLSADRIASSKFSKDKIDEFINSTIYLSDKNIEIQPNEKVDLKRLAIQLCIILNIKKTTYIKAPAGFGKTALFVLMAWDRKRKIIIVCPRNDIAESDYKNVLEVMSFFGLTDKISVELYYASEVKKSTHAIKAFTSDIIITNIDNYLKPTTDNHNADKLFTIMSSDVIFDEFDELVTGDPYFSCFVNLVKARHNYTNSFTLFTSATYYPLWELWDTAGQKTTILPNEKEHYPAAHSKPLLIELRDIEALNSINYNENNLVIVNLIEDAQIKFKQLDFDILYHSKYESGTKKYLIEQVYQEYDKYSILKNGKENVLGTQITRTSHDISFNTIYDTLLSHNDSMQGAGRCNRHGREDFGRLIIMRANTPENIKFRELTRDNEIANCWYDFLLEKKLNGKHVTLDEFYKIYNEFNIFLYKKILDFVKRKHRESLLVLSKIYPQNTKYSSEKSDIMSAGSNKLRSNGNEVFYICKIVGSDKWSNIFSHRIPNYSSIEEEFEGGKSYINRVIRAMKEIKNSKDERYDYSKVIKNEKYGMRKIEKFFKYNKTPFPRTDVVLDPVYGVIKKTTLDTIINIISNKKTNT